MTHFWTEIYDDLFKNLTFYFDGPNISSFIKNMLKNE